MSTSYPLYIDRRDEPVVEQLEPDEVYGVTHITSLYRTRTDITREQTAKDRMKNLVQSPAFEFVRTGRFRYLGVDGGSE